MSTKPKAMKYRVARQSVTGSAAVPVETGGDTAAAGAPSNTAQIPDAPAAPAAAAPQPTRRQLRIARRIAQKHGLSPQTDEEAVRMLQERGVDPFSNAHIVDLTRIDTAEKPGGGQQIKLPQTQGRKAGLPSKNVLGAEQREYEIRKIQRDIARRRQIKLGLLFARLAMFVFLPTIIAGYYFSSVATPLYSSKSEFLILNAEGGGASGGFGGLIPSQFATGQDAIATQSYLQSKDAMLRLDRDLGFREQFSNDGVDPIQRLPADASIEKTYKAYQRHIKLGYDQTEGVIRMEVTSPDPEMSLRYSEALIDYAEERVDHLSQEKREDAVKTAVESLEEAKAERRLAQERLVTLQEGSFLDPEGEIAGIRALISQAEQEIQLKEVALQTQLNNASPNRARVQSLETEIGILRDQLAKQSGRLTAAQSGASSLAAQTAEIRMAESDVATADLILQAALETKRTSEIEASRQVRYLSVSVQPIVAQDPSYPKAFEDTLLAFLIFSGVYLMLSLTVAVLKEQVSS